MSFSSLRGGVVRISLSSDDVSFASYTSPHIPTSFNFSGFPEPNWETEQAPSLDVARVWVRVNDEEVDLNAKTKERDQLRRDVADLDDQVSSNTVMATEKQTEADTLQKFAETTISEESVRKSEISKAIEDAERECREVEKLRDSILDLTVMQEKDATDLKMKLTSEGSRISAMETEIANILDEVVSTEKRSLEHKEQECAKHEKLLKEVAAAKKMADVIKGAFEHAQRQANRFSALPDGELALQMTQLDEAEREIVDVANLERDTIIESKFHSVLIHSLLLLLELIFTLMLFAHFYPSSGAAIGEIYA